MGYKMHTYSDRIVNPTELKASDVSIIDIAHALSMQCRYNGMVSEFYSVAQHSVLISHLVPEHVAKVGLLHDGSEAYVGDMIHPIKTQFPEFKEKIERQAEEAIFDHFGLSIGLLPEIEVWDRRISVNEMEQFMPQVDTFLAEQYDRIDGLYIEPWQPQKAELMFLRRAVELFSEGFKT